jgi:hypothetical protein
MISLNPLISYSISSSLQLTLVRTVPELQCAQYNRYLLFPTEPLYMLRHIVTLDVIPYYHHIFF